MELLSPAGGFDALKAAVDFGADAVYMGGTRFNARINAKNFTDDDLKKALEYAKARSTKVFVVLNTLLSDRELSDALEYAAFIYESGADAIIVQDVGLISLIKRHIPSMELHASTQMGISDADGALMCEDMGLSRAVLAREVSLENIAKIKSRCKIELEAFAHGAMCVSFSGACLFSSMIGGRSGNRGLCAQPCRKRMDYDASAANYCLSMADMCMIRHIDDMRSAGIGSIKLEGRMKSPEYVAMVTHAYRRALDGANADELCALERSMFAAFNRGEFTAGYYFGDGARTNRRASKAERIQLPQAAPRRTPLEIELSAHIGSPAALRMSCAAAEILVTGEIVQRAVVARDEGYFIRQLTKLSGTGFAPAHVSIDMDADAYMPVSAINELRRRAVDELTQMCVGSRQAPKISYSPPPTLVSAGKAQPLAVAKVYSTENVRAASDAGFDEIIYAPRDYADIDVRSLGVLSASRPLLLSLPVAILDEHLAEHIRRALDSGAFCGAEINNIGQLKINADKRIGGAFLNVFNVDAAVALTGMGLKRAHVSCELNFAQSRDIAAHAPAEMLVHGRMPLMNLFHCALAEDGCKMCKADPPPMLDEEGRRFPLRRTGARGKCQITLYNCMVYDVLDKLKAADEFAALRFDFAFESAEDISLAAARLASWRSGEGAEPLRNITRGHFNKKVI